MKCYGCSEYADGFGVCNHCGHWNDPVQLVGGPFTPNRELLRASLAKAGYRTNDAPTGETCGIRSGYAVCYLTRGHGGSHISPRQEWDRADDASPRAPDYGAMTDIECCASGYHRRKGEERCACGYKLGRARHEQCSDKVITRDQENEWLARGHDSGYRKATEEAIRRCDAQRDAYHPTLQAKMCEAAEDCRDRIKPMLRHVGRGNDLDYAIPKLACTTFLGASRTVCGKPATRYSCFNGPEVQQRNACDEHACPHVHVTPRCFHVNAGKPCTRYLEGTEGERASIVKWLRHEVDTSNYQPRQSALKQAADDIERGEHGRPYGRCSDSAIPEVKK